MVMTSRLYHMLVFAAALVFATAQVPCPYDVCRCTAENIDCTNLGLTKLPPLNPGAFPQHDLDISGNQITSIGDGELPHNLQDITSKGNPLATISDHAFQDSAYSLKNLILDNGVFTDLPKALDDLDSLSFLEIKHSMLKNIPVGKEILPNVYFIDFGYNQIENITNISRLKHSLLTRLILRNNQISDISAIGQLDYLRTLNLYNNKICDHHQVAQAIIPHQNTIDILELSHNCLTKIPDFSGIPELSRLGLKENQIDDCDSGVLPPTIERLMLHKNKLPCLPKAVLGLKNITVLLLENNLIQSIDNFEFPSSIRELHLFGNQISNITKMQFANGISSVNALFINDNPNLKVIADDAFEYMTNMTQMYMDHTGLTRIPVALKDLLSLTQLHIDANPDLQCTCGEAALEGWYQSLASTLTVTGKCGTTDVSAFLGQISTQCGGIIGK